MSNEFVQRQVITVDYKDVNIEVIQPQLAVLAADNPVDPGPLYIDVGALCYRRRNRSTNQQIGTPVDISSLDNSRIPFVRALIEELRLSQSSSRAIHQFVLSRYFVDWLDVQEQPYYFDNVASMKNAYCEYTRNLLHRVNSSGIGGQPLKQVTASQYQSGALTVVRLATGLSEPEVKGITTLITKRRDQASHVNLKLPSADEQAKTFATLLSFIDEAHRILVGNGEVPLHLVSPSGESCYLYTVEVDSGRTKTADFSIANLLLKSPVFPTLDQVKVHFGLVDDRKAIESARGAYRSSRRMYEKNNKDFRSALRQRFGNHAVVAGMLAFIAATGCNLSVAQALEVDTLEFVPSTKGKRFSGTKGRAGGKTVVPEFGLRFAPVFQKYLKLREWVLNGSDSALVFPYLSAKHGITQVGGSSIDALRMLFSKTLPRTMWVTPRQWRKNVSYQYVKLSGGDMTLTAEKLSNTEDMVRQAYSRPALEDFAGEMASFFEAMHQAAVDRTRTVERIPVRILDEKRPEAVTGAGACEKAPETQPERAQGFTELAPTPTCRDPETCLFCEFYAVHADEEDMRRLLSLRYLIQSIKHKQPIDHWQSKFGPTVHRIDEVLSAMQDADGDSQSTINRVREEVESGDLDEFWAIHFDTLVTLGAVS
ncbi:hypothetical protein [Geopseudomonas guangdongensis]|uniref:Uncharacterized protein n=1 Tax=Geopseudomonas guangdongensis TaxID=1245526 RepID=A0A1H2EN43_9GAMM|nr:hypothetical protein [Pseudomonas guangdongensis]SDT96168.1 hypothetical protein SAMN05216580_0704 [Pseudomonas guangdongensis]